MTAPAHSAEDVCVDDLGVELTRAISAQPSVAAALQLLTSTAVEHIQVADAAGMTVLSRHRFETVAATGGLPVAVDTLQYEFGGPCVAAILEADVQVRVDDLSTETRWPEFTAAAVAQTPVRSMLSCRVYLDAEDPFGALNLYAGTAQAFADDVARIAQLLAAHAAPAVALVSEREKAANLQRALESSRTIGAAMGVLMTRRLITADEAFDLLRTASQQNHCKLRDIATDVIDTGTLGGGPLNKPHRRVPQKL